jgi:NitT/TauT family transport system ATP-binding protein
VIEPVWERGQEHDRDQEHDTEATPLPALPPIVEFEGVEKTFHAGTRHAFTAIRDVSFRIEDRSGSGEFVAIVGPSGCGKSTILKTVAGLLRPTKGEVLVDGEPVRGVGRDRGMVFQAYTSFGWLTVRENVEYGLRLQGIAAAERRARAEKVLAKVGLADFANRYPKDLSGGMKQRVAIARTLVNRPRVVLMDEPFGALDPIARRGLQREFLDWKRRLGKAVLLVTHDLREAFRLADRVAVMDRGRIRQVGTREELTQTPADDFVREFVAEETA